MSTFWETRDRLATVHSNHSAPYLWDLIRKELLDTSGWQGLPTSATEAHYTLRDFDNDHGTDLFTECYEHDFMGYTHQFLWALHAIVHGIHAYDQAKAVAA